MFCRDGYYMRPTVSKSISHANLLCFGSWSVLPDYYYILVQYRYYCKYEDYYPSTVLFVVVQATSDFGPKCTGNAGFVGFPGGRAVLLAKIYRPAGTGILRGAVDDRRLPL